MTKNYIKQTVFKRIFRRQVYIFDKPGKALDKETENIFSSVFKEQYPK